MGKSRLEAFSDGVIAIIITIMVLELKAPGEANIHALVTLLPTFISYVLSFVFIAIYWNNHHHLLYVVKHISAGIMWANINLLFWLSLVPFATAWLGENHFESFPVCLYAVLLDLCGIAYTILQKAIAASHKEDTQLISVISSQKTKGIISLIIYTAAIPFAYVNPLISAILFAVVAIMWIIPDKNIERMTNEEHT